MLKYLLNQKKLFTPNSLRGYGYSGAWYDTTDPRVVLASAGDVYQFNDKLGSDIHIAQGTGSKQPETGTRSINSVNVLDYVSANAQALFDTTNAVATALSGTDSPFAMYAVLARDGSADNQNIISIESSSTGTPLICFRLTSANKLRCLKRDDASNILSKDSTGTIDTNPHIISIRFDGTNVKFYIDGVLDATQDLSSTLGATTLNQIRLASFRDTSTYFDGGLGTAIIVNSNPTDAVDDKIVGFLAHQYGLTANLDAGHAYKTTKPLE